MKSVVRSGISERGGNLPSIRVINGTVREGKAYRFAYGKNFTFTYLLSLFQWAWMYA